MESVCSSVEPSESEQSADQVGQVALSGQMEQSAGEVGLSGGPVHTGQVDHVGSCGAGGLVR